MANKKPSKPPLTKKKQAQVEKRKPASISGKALHYPASAAIAYQKSLDRLIAAMASETKREIEKLMTAPTAEKYFAQDKSIASESRILTNKLKKKFQQLFDRRSKMIAETMVKRVEKASSSSLHSSLKQLSGGLSLGTRVVPGYMKATLNASVVESVGLIRSIPEQYFTQIQGAVMRSITTGNGLADLVPFIENYEGVTKRRARIIAGDQTRKAYSNINADRMRALGVKKYKWIHSGGSREPRQLHQDYNGKIFSLDDPPIIQYAKGSLPQVRGKPGDLINCLCTMSPVITFEDDEDADK